MVGVSVQVSLAQPAAQHYETQIAADPERAGHLIACAYVRRENDAFADNVFYVSVDRGATWSHTLTSPASVDPSCTFGLKGTAFTASIHDVPRADGNSDSFLAVHRSADSGRTWTPSAVSLDTRSVDRNYVTVDDTRGPRRGRVYIHAYLQTPREPSGKPLPTSLALYTSTDDGKTFDHEVIVPGTQPGTPWFFVANGVVANDGTFVALVAALDRKKSNMSYRTDPASAPPAANGTLQIMRSPDGGRTVEISTITDVFYDWRVPQLSMSSLAIDRTSGPFKGRLYAAWPDARQGHTRIFLATSDNLGRTWTAPLAVDDNTVTLPNGDRPNDFMPMIAINKDGIVGLSWYDRRDSADNLSYTPRFSASRDGGMTWLPSIAVSAHPNTVEANDKRFNGGDTAGLTADAGGAFHPLWIDNHTGVHQMWTTSVTVRGTARR